jgi:hypothetical protein
MSEADMRRTLIGSLRALDAVPVENRVGPGTPDINYIGGWMELKWLRSWPKQPKTPVKLDHPLLPEQRAWLARRCRRGGQVWLMLQCRREWLLFWGETAAVIIGNVNKSDLLHHVTRYWPNGLNEQELIEVLRGPQGL